MSEIKVLEGGIFTDHRGTLTYLDVEPLGVRRHYFIRNADTTVIRGWHGHQHERKWFQCVKGAFRLAFVRPDDWDSPSPDLPAEVFELSDRREQMVCLPKGYANCIRAVEPDSILMVWSDKYIDEAHADSWRWPAQMWGGEKL